MIRLFKVNYIMINSYMAGYCNKKMVHTITSVHHFLLTLSTDSISLTFKRMILYYLRVKYLQSIIFSNIQIEANRSSGTGYTPPDFKKPSKQNNCYIQDYHSNPL